MFSIFSLYVFVINLIHLNYIYSFEASSTNNINNYNIKNIINNINSFPGKYLRFLEEEETKEKASNWITKKVFELLRIEVGAFINDKMTNVSEKCKETLYHYLIFNVTNDIYNISTFHIRKFFEGATKHKNDMSTYDICMYNNFRYRKEYNKGIFANSSYLIMTLDESNRKKTNNGSEYYYSKSTQVEDILYIRAFCFPQVTENGVDVCNESDYYNFIMQVNNDLNDIMDLRHVEQINYFILKPEDFSGGITFLKLIPFFLGFIISLLIIFRQFIIYLLKKCCFKNLDEKSKLLVKDSEDEEFKIKEDIDESDLNNSIKLDSNVSYPKWVKVYNKCFNLTENFKELYNFSLNSTDINNDSGLTYIRGLKSFSFFFLIFGLTFFTFINSFSKTYSKFLMYEFLNYFLYPIFFIGLRYFPRIIFSCSGYTLSFKYVSYLQKNNSCFAIFKFILYQIHKYFILFIFFLFERYSLFIISNAGTLYPRPMFKYFEKNILSKPEGGMFLISFLDLTNIYTRDGNKRVDQTLIDYFWLPFNETFFFIIGVIIISFGYKYKFRIDYVILILIPLILIGKLIFSYLKKTYEGEDYYATLFYYLFDYGKFMIHPLFNLPYYLIGMYFGFINYSVQKGITSFEIINSVQDKAMIDLQNMLMGGNNNEEDKANDTEENKENEKDEEDNNDNNKKEIRAELKELPFLKGGVSIIMWLNLHGIRLIGIIMAILLLFFFISHIIYYYATIGREYNSLYDNLRKLDENAENINNTAYDNEYQKMEDLLLLGNYIKNNFINFMYRIDIEIVVILVQAILFILYFKGQNFVNDFFCHIFWGVLNKPYFSLILVANPLILYIFYQSETRIILNFFNILLYSIIGGCIVFLFGTFIYLFFELPFKRLIHNIFSLEDQEDINDNEDNLDINKKKDN